MQCFFSLPLTPLLPHPLHIGPRTLTFTSATLCATKQVQEFGYHFTFQIVVLIETSISFFPVQINNAKASTKTFINIFINLYLPFIPFFFFSFSGFDIHDQLLDLIFMTHSLTHCSERLLLQT